MELYPVLRYLTIHLHYNMDVQCDLAIMRICIEVISTPDKRSDRQCAYTHKHAYSHVDTHKYTIYMQYI